MFIQTLISVFFFETSVLSEKLFLAFHARTSSSSSKSLGEGAGFGNSRGDSSPGVQILATSPPTSSLEGTDCRD